jgi:hypothetical protein
MSQALSDRSKCIIADKRTESEFADEVSLIKEQTRETLALLRKLVEMLLPKGDPDKLTLEDLLAALIAQQARILAIVGQLRLDMAAVLELLPPAGGGLPGKQQPPNGGLQS